MNFDFVAERATFLERPNRYVVVACLESSGEVVVAHCADPGRLAELLLPGATVWLSAAAPALTSSPALARKTAWDLRLVEHPEVGTLISLDTRVPNRIFAEGLHAGFFAEFAGHIQVERERALPLDSVSPARRKVPHSRIDFRLTFPNASVEWVEVKSASLVVGTEARFPDAVTARAARHLGELATMARRGEKTSVVFIVQRPDADALVAHRATDPVFAYALDDARSAGVRVIAATCQVTTTSINLDRMIPVL